MSTEGGVTMTTDQTTATRWRHRRIVLSRGNAVERYPLPRDGEQAHHMPGAEVWWGESDDEAIAEVERLDAEEMAREQRCARVLIIAALQLDEELDVGGEIGEVSQSITDGAIDDSTGIETVPLPSGKHGWKRNSHLRLPVGFLPPEWRGRQVRVTFEVEPGQSEPQDELQRLRALVAELRDTDIPEEELDRAERERARMWAAGEDLAACSALAMMTAELTRLRKLLAGEAP
jgi:hypothetical protein